MRNIDYYNKKMDKLHKLSSVMVIATIILLIFIIVHSIRGGLEYLDRYSDLGPNNSGGLVLLFVTTMSPIWLFPLIGMDCIVTIALVILIFSIVRKYYNCCIGILEFYNNTKNVHNNQRDYIEKCKNNIKKISIITQVINIIGVFLMFFMFLSDKFLNNIVWYGVSGVILIFLNVISMIICSFMYSKIDIMKEIDHSYFIKTGIDSLDYYLRKINILCVVKCITITMCLVILYVIIVLFHLAENNAYLLYFLIFVIIMITIGINYILNTKKDKYITVLSNKKSKQY